MIPFGLELLDRMVLAVEKVRDRLRRATGALESANISYAVIGGNAIAAWVARVDTAAVRNTQDVDILLNRGDLSATIIALEQAGFVYRHAASLDMFLDGAEASARDAVHIVFANEKVRSDHLLPSAQLDEVEAMGDGTFRYLNLEALVRMKLIAFRDKDRTHLRDLVEVGLIDANWPARFIPKLAERLQQILDTPDG